MLAKYDHARCQVGEAIARSRGSQPTSELLPVTAFRRMANSIGVVPLQQSDDNLSLPVCLKVESANLA